MNARVALEMARAEEARLAIKRKAAWETDPGNLHIAHNIFNAYGYDNAHKAWAKAHAEVVRLEAELQAVLEVA